MKYFIWNVIKVNQVIGRLPKAPIPTYNKNQAGVRVYIFVSET